MKIVLVCSLDGLSNEKKGLITKGILEKEGYKVIILNVANINESKLMQSTFPFNYFYKLKFYLYQRKIIKNYPLLEVMRIRAQLLYQRLKRINNYKVIICQLADDSLILTHKLSCLKILDCPTPWFEEQKNSNQFTKNYLQKILANEVKIYQSSDYICYSWHTYTDFVKKNIFDSKKYFVFDWGCTLSKKRAKFKTPPKIIFVGYLGGYWINLPLLSYLTKISPFPIDVFGRPKPDPKYKLNYKGYLSDLNILSNYQFGLVTITRDKLRKIGWSYKQMDYLSFGLPILMPEWRKDPFFKKVSVHYNKKNFISVVRSINKKKWQCLSKNSHLLAKNYTWDKTSKEFINIINKYEKEKKGN